MVTFSLTVHDKVIGTLLQPLAERLQDLTPALRQVGEAIRSSVIDNFRESRSPEGDPWPKSQRVREHGGKTLVNTATLQNSIHVQAGKDWVSVGSPVKYAATHQFGAEKGAFGVVAVQVREHLRSLRGKDVKVRAHTRKTKLPWGDIPARPFLGLREDDMSTIQEIISGHLIKGVRA